MIRPLLLLGLGLFLLSCTTSSPRPPDVQARVEHVRALLDSWSGQGDILEKARNELDGILAQDPRSAPAHREYARYYIMSGYIMNNEVDPEALRAAEQSLKTALELDPKYSDAYVLAGHLYLLQKRNQDAKDALDKAQTLGSTNPWLDINRAAIYMAEGNPGVAQASYHIVVDRGTSDRRAMEGALDGLIYAYRAMHQDGDADKTYRQLIAYSPDVAWNYGNYGGFLLCRMDDFDGAIVQFRAALSKMPYGLAYRGLAAALYRKWAEHMLNDEPALAAGLVEEAQTLYDGSPVEVFGRNCRDSKPALERVKMAVDMEEFRKKAQSGAAVQP